MSDPVIIGNATLYLGDCADVLKTIADESVDSVVCDPPYHLTQASRGGHARTNNPEMPHGRHRIGDKGFMGKVWDGGDIAHRVEMWAECLRVLKPGGHLLAFAGSRTYHRMTCAIEDAGFEIRDQIMWLYGSGFPKSMNVAKAIESGGGRPEDIRRMAMGAEYEPSGRGRANYDHGGASAMNGGVGAWAPTTDAARQWEGWGTALKPAHEPIVVARKPLTGTVAANVLAHGTGALNIDACRVPTSDSLGGGDQSAKTTIKTDGWNRPWMQDEDAKAAHAARVNANVEKAEALGRWPANIIHDGSPEVLEAFPDAPGQMATAKADGSASANAIYGTLRNVTANPEPRVKFDKSAARFFYCAKASRQDRNEGIGGSDTPAVGTESTMRDRETADWQERNGNHHPTVKPTDLMAYLCRLVTPPNGTVLDPFMGSGSTGKAAMREGFRFIGIDMTPEYVDIAKARIRFEIERVMQERDRAEQERIEAARQPDMFAESA